MRGLAAVVGAIAGLTLFLAAVLAMIDLSKAQHQAGGRPAELDSQQQALFLYMGLLIGPVAAAAGAVAGVRLVDGPRPPDEERDEAIEPDEGPEQPDGRPASPPSDTLDHP
jgi:hypothetical protein